MRYSIVAAGLVAAASAKTTLTAYTEVTITSCAPTHTACPYKSDKHEWATWNPEDPSEASTTDAAHTWGTWDPKDPAEETSTATWGTWADPAEETSTATWGTWADPAEETSTKTWGTWADPSEETETASTTWGTWDPAQTTGEAASSSWAAWSSAAASSSADAAECPQYTATAPPAWFSQLPSSVLSSLAAKWTGAPPADWCYYSYTNGVVTETKTPDATAAESTWAAWSAAATDASATGVKGASATGSGPIAKYTGAANVNAASFVMAGAAAVAAVVLA